MTQSPQESFPVRIGRSLWLAAAAVVAAVLVVGGTSLWLAMRIHRNNSAVQEEYDHILRLDEVHSLFDDAIFGLHQMDSTGRFDRAAETLVMQEEVVRRLDALAATHQGEAGARERAVLDELRRLSAEGRDLTQRLARGDGRLGRGELEWLNRTTHTVPLRAAELAGTHRARVASLVGSSQELLRMILALYALWTLAGVAIVLAARHAANGRVARPLRRLADAARLVSEGRLDTRVRVASADEIGLLSHTFNLMAGRLDEREQALRQAKAALEDRVREVQALSEERRSHAAVEERERLARELHDGLAQTLGALHLGLQGALARCREQPALAADLGEMAGATAAAYEDVRQSIFGLRTFVSRGLGLVPTLTEYLHEFSAHSGIAVDLATGGAVGEVPPATEVQAVRIIQEALTNVRKHAKCARARVGVERDGAWLRVSVEDDGVGWDGPATNGGMHFGLQMMRERAESLGGTLEVDAAAGRGTRVVASLPGEVA